MDHLDLKKFFRNKDIKKYMAALFVAGILLMAFSSQPLKIGTSGFEESSANEKKDEIDCRFRSGLPSFGRGLHDGYGGLGAAGQ